MGFFNGRHRARPGMWYGSYHGDWNTAHPGVWARGEGSAGGFFKGDVWGTGTPDWDREWFARHGMDMPSRVKLVDGKAKPGEFRLGARLDPGESVVVEIKIDPETGDVSGQSLGVRGPHE